MEDAAQWKIEPGQRVRVISRRGQMEAFASVGHKTAAGVVFGNFHFSAEHNVNSATNRAVDPVAKIPEYKVFAVCIEPVG